MSHAVSPFRHTRLLSDAPADDHATRAFFSGGGLEDDALPNGTRLDARYEIVRVLGRGGFGITYEARDSQSGSILAIKEFFPAGCARQNGQVVVGTAQTFERLEASRKRFLEEARVLKGIRHPNLVRVLAAFEERGTAFLVMEKLHGETLLQLVENHGALEEKVALELCEKLCEALDALHRVGFLHLDVKPENAFVCDFDDAEKRRVVLMDFDLLRPIAGGIKRDTQPLFHATDCGTPGYAPVEQYSQGTELSRETDLYALGATLWHLLNGAPPPASTDRAASGEEFSGARWNRLSASTREAISFAMQVRQHDRPACVHDFQLALRGEWNKTLQNTMRSAVTTSTTTRRATGVLRASQLPKNPTSAFSSAPALAVGGSASTRGVPRNEIYRLQTPVGVDVKWPDFCPCCARKTDVFLLLRSAGETFRVPYCTLCLRHIAAHKQATCGGAGGIALGLSLAGAGFAMSNPYIGPLGVVVHFTAMIYGGLQMGHADRLTTSQCCAVEAAVSLQTKNARFWKFRSGRYTAEFKRLNG